MALNRASKSRESGMKLVDVLKKECVLVGVELCDKAAVLREVARTAKKSPILKEVSEEEIFQKLHERELLGSTGFGDGIAIPHCRVEGASEFLVGIISVPTGVDFQAVDDKKVELIFFIVGPTGEPNKHIKLLSLISRTLLVPGTVKEMVSAETTESLRDRFLGFTRSDIDTDDQSSKTMFHVFIQDEHLFREILGVLNAESSSMVVVESENTGTYLAKIPLFADFWRDSPQRFTKIIVAVVEKALANETLRRIETVTGDLTECSGVMVTVQDILYLIGSLEA